MGFVPTSVLAIGVLPYCFGAKMCQMGGAGVATSLDSTSGNVNPALMANVGRQAALQPLLVIQKETVDTSQTGLTNGTSFPKPQGPQTNRKNVYAAGFFGFNYDYTPEWSFGFSTAGGGNNARYKKSLISPALSAPRKLETMASLVSTIAAYKPTSNQAYGISLIGGYFQVKNNLTLFPSGATTKGANKTDWSLGMGARLGGQWNVSKLLSLGAAASTPIFFQKLKKYSDVIPYAPQLPVIATVGSAFHIFEKTDILFDLERLFWRKTSSSGKNPPGGQGWKDTFVFKVGAQHDLTKEVKIRAGYNYGKSPIPKNNVLFSALNEVITVTEHVFSAGGSYTFSPTMSLDFGAGYMFPHKITDNGAGIAGAAAKGLNVKARGLVLTFGFNLTY
jgi:long-chain fatty acid transport protein